MIQGDGQRGAGAWRSNAMMMLLTTYHDGDDARTLHTAIVCTISIESIL